MKLSLKLNGKETAFDIAGPELLLDLLRDHGYHGTKRGCESGDCGSCAVSIDGKTVCSCLYFAGQAEGREVTTIEGLGTMEAPHSLQSCFVETAGVQCGFCIPGMLLSAKQLLEEIPNPKEGDIRAAMDGHLCRCSGYKKQFEAIILASKRMTAGRSKARKAARGVKR